MDETKAHRQLNTLDDVQQVVLFPVAFKAQLGIGADAYTSMWLGKRLQTIWDVAGMGATGAGVASSTTVASTFFGSTGWLSAIGLGTTAVTPVGWVAAAAVASAGAYYGITRLIGDYSSERVTEIPKFINSPLDILGASLFDLIAPLALQVAAIDGEIATEELLEIENYFQSDWGLDPAFVKPAIIVISENAPRSRIDDTATSLAEFLHDNPDCNIDHLITTIVRSLRSIAEADGTVLEIEEMAIDRVERTLLASKPSAIRKFGSSAQKLVSSTSSKVRRSFQAD